MSNPFGDNGMFQPEQPYGQVAKAQQLAKEAPISGAPLPGSGTTAAPATQGGPPAAPAGPMATPFISAPSASAYQHQLANTWRALAKTPGASEEVKAIAKVARQRLKTAHQISQRVGY